MNPNKKKSRLKADLKTKSEDIEVWTKKLKITRGIFEIHDTTPKLNTKFSKP